MAFRDIRIIGDPILRTVCQEITEITPAIRQLVDDLMETVDAPGRAGLSANQIGHDVRAFSYNIDGKHGYILNPVIVDLSEDEYQDGDEGCLSVPDLWYPCERAWYAKCEGIDLDGNTVTLAGEEIWARLIQHEVDHLDGHIYIDRLKRHERKKALKDIRAKGW